MKIAVPTGEGFVDEQFETSARFRIYALDENFTVDTVEDYTASANGSSPASPAGTLADALAELGVTHALAHHMQIDMIHMLHARRICVVRGASGPADEAVRSFVRGYLFDSSEEAEPEAEHSKYEAAS